jgi:predicted RNase H-like HicB family nuclease
MKPTRYTFPAYFYFDDDGITIEFPDLPGCLPCAQTPEEAFSRAEEAMGLHLYGMEQDGDEIPTPTPVQDLHPEDGAVIAMIDVFMPSIRDKASNRVVKKTLTIPAWLNHEAEAANINFSQVLQEGLKRYLGETQP